MWVQVPPAPPMCASGRDGWGTALLMPSHAGSSPAWRSSITNAVLAQYRERIGPNDEDVG